MIVRGVAAGEPRAELIVRGAAGRRAMDAPRLLTALSWLREDGAAGRRHAARFPRSGEAMEVPAARDIVPQIQTLLDLFRTEASPSSSPSSRFRARACPGRASCTSIDGRSGPDADSACLLFLPARRGQCPRDSDLARGRRAWSSPSNYYDGFNGTALDQALRSRNITTSCSRAP